MKVGSETRTRRAVLLVGALAAAMACSKPVDEAVQTLKTVPIAIVLVRSDARAIEIADAFLAARGLNWGRAVTVGRTSADWYRVEYETGVNDVERVVLVNPENAQAELPLAR